MSLNEEDMQSEQYNLNNNPAPSYALPTYDESLQTEHNSHACSLSENALPSYEEAIQIK